jgi:bifunctional DNA primase/polymerase-like protein
MPQAQPIPSAPEAAIDYARCGTPVFPCNPIDKAPLTPHGHKDATTDEAQICAWWTQWPNAMIGMPTGSRSGRIALDLDLDPAKNLDGKTALDQLIAQYGPLPPTWETITPRGGHVFFTHDPHVEIRNSTSKIGPGIDVRGEGGYVILPPSQTASGGTYQWKPGGPKDPASMPPWLTTRAKTKRMTPRARAALEGECKKVAAALPGTRNSALNTAAFNLFQLVAAGELDEQDARDRLYEAAEICGLVADDGAPSVWATINSGAAAGRQQPRPSSQSQTQTTLPIIELKDGEMLRILDEIEDALLVSGVPIFSRAGRLVEPVIESMAASGGRKTAVACLRELSPESFLGLAATSATFQKHKRKNLVDTDPPMLHLRVILASERRWRFPHVTGVITTPTLRPDGSLLIEPGYDPETELCLVEVPGFRLPPIPEHPTKDQANASLKLLVDLLSEFSFKRSGGEHEMRLNRSVALSALLTPLVRGSLSTAPLHLIRAHMAGTGKSYLVDTAAAIATGRHCPAMTAPRSGEEAEKRLHAVVLGGMLMFSLDNCARDLEGEFLCQMAERPIVKIRPLGRSETSDCDVHTAVYATGNSIGLKGDMVRRGLVCNLESLDERPELRRFARNALKTAQANRANYVAAGLTIMRSYLAAGAPEVCGPFGSYEEWSRMVRSPLIWLGEPDPVASVDTTQADDPELAELREWFILWLAEFKLDEPYTSATFVEAARAAPVGFNPNLFKEFLLRVAADKNGDISTKRLGEWLHRNCGRVVRVVESNGSVNRYWMIKGRDRLHIATFRLSEVR